MYCNFHRKLPFTLQITSNSRSVIFVGLLLLTFAHSLAVWCRCCYGSSMRCYTGQGYVFAKHHRRLSGIAVALLQPFVCVYVFLPARAALRSTGLSVLQVFISYLCMVRMG